MALLNFDSTQYEKNADFEPVPAGDYNAVIIASEWQPTKNGNGRYLKLEFEIYEGQYKGRHVFTRLNLENQSQDAVRIARGDLKAICEAVGVLKPRDSSELHNLPLRITVQMKKRDDGSFSNEIPINGYGKKMSAQGQGASPASDKSSLPPWERK